MTTLTITRPDDWHVHLRDGDVLKDTVRDISRYNGRALIMPNTVPPVTNTDMALATVIVSLLNNTVSNLNLLWRFT